MSDLSISELVEHWKHEGLPVGGLSASERMAIVEDAQGSFMAEFVAKTADELQRLSDKDLVECHYWAMNEATR